MVSAFRVCIPATPEESDFTSVQDRAAACMARHQLARAPQEPTPPQAQLILRARAESSRDHWLAPIGAPRQSPGETGPGTPGEPARAGSGQPAPRPMPAGPPPLLAHMSEERYFELLDWTGRQIRDGKRGHLAPHLRPALERLELDVEAWVDNVERYGGLFHRLAGKLGRLKELARSTGVAWLHGNSGARRLYARAG